MILSKGSKKIYVAEEVTSERACRKLCRIEEVFGCSPEPIVTDLAIAPDFRASPQAVGSIRGKQDIEQ
jgi:hypothetical protein